MYVGATLLGYFRVPLLPVHLGAQAGVFVLLLAPAYFAPLRHFAAAYHQRQEALAAAEILAPLSRAAAEGTSGVNAAMAYGTDGALAALGLRALCDDKGAQVVYAPAPVGGLTPIEIETLPFTERPALLEGAVGLVSTVPDYLRFGQMLLNNGMLGGVRLLQASTVALMTANRLSDSIVSARGGIGWALLNVNVALDAATFNYPVSRGEYGWDGSAGTIFWVDPSLDMVTVLMTQSVPPNPDGFRQEFKTRIRKSVVK